MSRLFSCDYDHYDMIKSHWTVNFYEMDTEPSAGKNDGFWLLSGIFKEYMKQKKLMAVLRKVNSYSVFICRLIKNLIM